MIVLDPRVGSIELLNEFKPYDVEVKVKQVDFGDAWWWGEGADGPVKVGVERKVIPDLVSSMRSNRLSGFQLRGLLKTYAWVYLLVEGVYRCGPGDVIEIYGGKKKSMGRGGSIWTPLRINGRPILYREVDHYLASLEHKCGVTVAFTANKEQTAAWMVSRYGWWQKEWAKHDAHEAIYAPYEHIVPARQGSLQFKPIGPVEMVAAQLPGISKKAYEFRKHFSTVEELVKASVGALEKVDGVGKKGAQSIHDWLRGK